MMRPSPRRSLSSSSSLPTATGVTTTTSTVSFPSTITPVSTKLPSPTPSSSTRSPFEKRRKAGPIRADQAGQPHHLHSRAGASSGPTFDDYPSCDNVGNTLLSCFPQSNTTLTQAEWSKFIWNANYPTFVENGQVDVWLYQADSGEEVRNWSGLTNAQGSIEIRPEEDWWKGQDRAREIRVGETETFSYYFVVVPGGQTLDGGESHQNTFKAVQTAPLSVALASISSASVASASASSISAAEASSSASAAASASSAGEGQGGRATDGTLQNGNSNDPGFPKWAIAVITILGVFLLISLLALWCFLLAASRRRKAREDREQSEKEWQRKEGGDHPDKANLSALSAASTDRKQDDVVHGDEKEGNIATSQRGLEGLPTVALSAATPRRDQASDAASIATARPPSRLSATTPTPGLNPSQLALNRQRSGASGIGSQTSGAGLVRAGSGAGAGDNSSIASSGPISPSDAEDLAVAFRQAMRKAGDQPLTEDSSPETESPPARTPASALMRRELQGEGVGIKPVGDRKSYHLQGAEDDDDTR